MASTTDMVTRGRQWLKLARTDRRSQKDHEDHLFPSQKDGKFFEELYAKRPDAARREPLSFIVETAFGCALR